MNQAVLQASTEGRDLWQRQARKILAAEIRNAPPARWRNVKIEATGDFWRGRVRPRIVLVGKWLEAAGFKSGHRVEIRVRRSGVLTVRFVKEKKGGSL